MWTVDGSWRDRPLFTKPIAACKSHHSFPRPDPCVQYPANMLQRLKQSRLGKVLYRLSRSSFGSPLRLLARLVQHERLNPSHLAWRNRRHNRQQMQILARFEAKTRRPG